MVSTAHPEVYRREIVIFPFVYTGCIRGEDRRSITPPELLHMFSLRGKQCDAFERAEIFLKHW